MEATPVVGIVMGSDSDWPLVKKAWDTLGDFGGPVGNAEAALANPNLPPEERVALRRRRFPRWTDHS